MNIVFAGYTWENALNFYRNAEKIEKVKINFENVEN
jgi:hypothetical protein